MKWKLVPVEPTEDMLFQGQGYIDCEGRQASVVFQAMLYAVPNPLDDAELVELVARILATPNMTPATLEMSWRIYVHDARAAIAAIGGK